MEDSKQHIGDNMRILMLMLYALIFISCAKHNEAKQQKTISDNNIMKDIINNDDHSSDNDKVLNQKSKTLQQFNETLTKDRKQYKAKCDKHDGDACIKLAISYHVESLDSNSQQIRNLYQRATIYLKESCDNGDFRACSALGGLYESGDGVGKIDKDKSIKLYKIACDNGDSRGCFNLGINAKGCLTCQVEDSKKLLESISYFKKACEYGSATGCYMVGNIYSQTDKKIVENQNSLSKEFLKKACDMGDKRGCL